MPGYYSGLELSICVANSPIYISLDTLHRKFETNISRNETAPPRFCIHVCARYIYSHDRSVYFAVLRLRADRGNI
jgi:hypothetical protein